ncbi:MAG: hypothetical protein ACFFAU_00990 [Candidatus Hodarchaeota archaeon]
MSIHRSLKPRNTKPRSVLKRHERLAKAIRENKWREGMSVYSLPKFNPPNLKTGKIAEEKIKTTLGGRNLIQEHLAAKEKSKKEKKQKKQSREITGVR